jgi:hypothetical protein
MGTDRLFGFVMSIACLALAGLGLLAGSHAWRFWVIASLAFACTAYFWPSVLHPLNYAWFRLGLVLHKIMSPLILGLFFFLAVTPIGLLMRLRGKRPLELAFLPEATSYWAKRDNAQPGSMANQY